LGVLEFKLAKIGGIFGIGRSISYTRPKTNEPPLKKGPFPKKDSLPTTIFQGTCDSFRGKYMDVSKNRVPQNGYNGKPYLQMDDLGGKPHYFRKHPYLGIIYSSQVWHPFRRLLLGWSGGKNPKF